MLKILAEVWRGNRSLAETFWFWFIAFVIVLPSVSSLVIAYYSGPIDRILFIIVYEALVWGVSIWVSVGLWRSAEVYRGPLRWSIPAQFMAGLVFISIFVSLAASILPMLGYSGSLYPWSNGGK